MIFQKGMPLKALFHKEEDEEEEEEDFFSHVLFSQNGRYFSAVPVSVAPVAGGMRPCQSSGRRVKERLCSGSDPDSDALTAPSSRNTHSRHPG